MKTLLLSAAALVAVAGVAPAIAQPVPPAGHPAMAMQPMTRADLVQEVQEHFAMLDTDKDGFITKTEMDAGKAAMRQKMADHMQQRGADMFDKMDANHDGSISRAEFDAAHQAMAANMVKGGGMPMHRAGMHGTRGAMAGHMFEMADADKDGKVSLQEATAAATAHFDKADANHDGTLTPDEMRAAHQAMGGKPGQR